MQEGYKTRQRKGEELELGSLLLVQEAETRVRIYPTGSLPQQGLLRKRLAILSCWNGDQQVFHTDSVSTECLPVWVSCATKEGLSQEPPDVFGGTSKAKTPFLGYWGCHNMVLQMVAQKQQSRGW